MGDPSQIWDLQLWWNCWWSIQIRISGLAAPGLFAPSLPINADCQECRMSRQTGHWSMAPGQTWATKICGWRLRKLNMTSINHKDQSWSESCLITILRKWWLAMVEEPAIYCRVVLILLGWYASQSIRGEKPFQRCSTSGFSNCSHVNSLCVAGAFPLMCSTHALTWLCRTMDQGVTMQGPRPRIDPNFSLRIICPSR